ncbi:MAG: putative addiction module antidote protein [Parcubacteria group bacterium CG_4_9_14_0_2_um_filter_41_8]|nr:MAG: putative addiction module antidote protein [Parcubacteria group bacterium CG1_02_41_12]PIP67036.1 MAG: putative addiction module antidote protein [Parcubacteria group bacterium CG22_combo_CG10-13_8_21_14_all_41_9]PIR56917.1 MAG: putative addiction module antidote protein [Parcubacteria group bacterium CG10_big_fil_rev_8_21_14_0_10_41_35]PJC40862.1 MAG: putative addiction module antidote protein [Parcubacteria group bacterium CG_4_9_14_0_2_um_filter_41_8]
MRNYKDFKTYHIEKLKDPKQAQKYLDIAIADYEQNQDIDEFLVALRDVASAKGGFSKLSDATGLNRQNLYRALAKGGNPRLETLGAILKSLGFRLSVEPIMGSM